MGQMKKRAEGAVEEVVGKVKKGIGAALGNEKLEAQGRAEELGGDWLGASETVAVGATRAFEVAATAVITSTAITATPPTINAIVCVRRADRR